nr:hypothetical protein [Oceanococcus sp. HetDA_MAG_MS8]
MNGIHPELVELITVVGWLGLISTLVAVLAPVLPQRWRDSEWIPLFETVGVASAVGLALLVLSILDHETAVATIAAIAFITTVGASHDDFLS